MAEIALKPRGGILLTTGVTTRGGLAGWHFG